MPENVPIAENPEEGNVSEYPSDISNDGPIVVANEFADVVLRRVHTRNGMRLDIWSPRRGTRILLDAVALDCLSFQEPELVTEMLSRNPGQ